MKGPAMTTHVETRHAIHPDHARGMDTAQLRQHFLVEGLFAAVGEGHVSAQHVVKQLLSYVMKSHLKTMMKQLISTLLLQHFKNCSQKSHLVMLNVTVDTLVSLKLNHVVVMQRQWRSSN